MSNRAPRGAQDLDALLEDLDLLPERGRPTRGVSPAGPDRAGACRHHRPPPVGASAAEARVPVCVPACAQSIRQTAARDVHLAVSLVLGDPQAADALNRFAERCGAETEGALVFGCLLFLAGHSDAAEYWWQYAAGGESPTAAFCLYLLHRHQGQHRTAQLWRLEADGLQTGDRRSPEHRRPGSPPLLSSEARQALLAQCRQGKSPHLPPAVEAAVNSLYGSSHHLLDREVDAYPLPHSGLPQRLAQAASR
ncbi:hypothetical protein GXW83_13685 [Streptacidiphilus sp. PB12-B1b]|uniref:hypothetical protein n=1 Tax=Streptacidiphilus sp. PB12-B1b TaxID=2705012 RepID=UPI0015FB0908|nr:hypothetical protein [Streptacidiphilus sp. PB12-B1b]QMU76639.1 hypothetical protein GXW83_13685 [Streptacidiphilus sp. PB12-B1b]